MAQFTLDDFRHGVDTRRASFARPPGALSKAVNVHITGAGEIEKRKAFVEIATLPEGCFGLAALHNALYTFGSISPPAMPSGVVFQQLTDPTGGAMTEVLDIEAFDGEGFVVAKFGDTVRCFYNGARVTDLDPDVSRYRFRITGGSHSAGVNKITSITVGGVEILDTDVDWVTSHEATAAAVAAQINSYASSPNYTAYVYSDMAEVVIASPHGTISTGAAVVVTVAGDVIVAGSTGAFEAPPAPGSARTAGQKVYVTSGSNLLFSAVLDATNFSPNSTGGGFINTSTHSSGAVDLAGTELFYEDLIIFGRSEAQRWDIESDDADNRLLQVFRSTGLIGARAALSYLDGPTLFLSPQGVRVVQTRDSSGRSLARGDSKPIDRELKAYLATLTAGDRRRAILLTEPEDDRVWVIVGARIYVRSWFAGWGDPGWTEYDPGFTVADFAVLDDRLFLLASDRKIYLYGGTTGSEYDDSTALVRIAYANGRAPANLKGLNSVDIGLEGTWTVRQALHPDDDDFEDAQEIGVFTRQTFDQPQYPVVGQTSHVSVEFSNSTAEYARITSLIFHYKTDDAG